MSLSSSSSFFCQLPKASAHIEMESRPLTLAGLSGAQRVSTPAVLLANFVCIHCWIHGGCWRRWDGGSIRITISVHGPARKVLAKLEGMITSTSGEAGGSLLYSLMCSYLKERTGAVNIWVKTFNSFHLYSNWNVNIVSWAEKGESRGASDAAKPTAILM